MWWTRRTNRGPAGCAGAAGAGFLWAGFGALAFVAAACGPGQSQALEQDLETLKQQLAEVRRASLAQSARVEELGNQVFLLADRVDSNQVVLLRRRDVPKLKVVHLQPESGPGEGGGDRALGAPEPAPVSQPPPEEPTRVAIREPEASTPLVAPQAGAPGAAPRQEAPEAVSPDRSNPLDLYRRALGLYERGEPAAAAGAFQEFLERYPAHPYADNALYWIGECRYDLKDYPAALESFRQVMARYPNGNKVPAAMLKAGYSLRELGEMAEAGRALEELVQTYPDSPAARLARERLAARGGAAAP